MATQKTLPASFKAGRSIRLGSTVYALGDPIPKAVVAALRNASALLSRRWIIPSPAADGSKLKETTPRPTTLGASERRSLLS